MSIGENIVKWIKEQRIIWLGHLERMEEDRMSKKIFTQELEGTRRRGRPGKGWRKDVERNLQVMGVKRWKELVTDRDKMERHCLTVQSPQRAITPMEEEEVLLQTTHAQISIITYLTFICPCIASISLKYNQQDATFSRPISFYKLLYMFQAVPPPIIRSTKLYIRRQVLSNQHCCLLLSWIFYFKLPCRWSLHM
jgi:hypothetical protein